MSTLLKNNAASGKKGLQAPPFAQVNLLPTDMRDARKDAMIKRLLLLLLAVVTALSVFIFFIALGVEMNAQNKLNDAEAETAALRNEKASLLYVMATYEQLDSAELAEVAAMSAEINWQTYLDAIASVIPAEQSVISVSAEGNTANTVLIDEHPLMQPRVGTLTFVTRSETTPDIAEWLRALNKVPGFQDAYFNTAELDEKDGVFYETETTIEINQSALSQRVDTYGAADADEEN